MTLSYDRWGIQAHLGSCIDVMRGMEPESIHAILTDPPYGLAELPTDKVVKALTEWVSGNREYIPTGGAGFMSLRWDCFVPPPAAWDECYRVMKPGAYMLVFSGTRTADLMGISIRLAGFTIRETVQWIYASGMPKGLNIGKAIDRAAGVDREVIKTIPDRWTNKSSVLNYATDRPQTEVSVLGDPITDAAKQWDGWNTALKPSQEPVIVAQKPFKGTISGNVLKHGTGGLNIGACRVGYRPERPLNRLASIGYGGSEAQGAVNDGGAGRWPANVVFSHSEDCTEDSCVDSCPVVELDRQSGASKSPATYTRKADGFGSFKTLGERTGKESLNFGDSGGASRYFPCFRFEAKAPAKERPVVRSLSPLRLRADLTDSEREFVLAELAAAGVDVS